VVSQEIKVQTDNSSVRADIDGDGAVGFGDFLVLSTNFGSSQVTPTNSGDLHGDQQVAFADFLIYSVEMASPSGTVISHEVVPPTNGGSSTFQQFLVLSSNFGSQNATTEAGDRDGNGVINFADFLIFSRSIDA